MTNQKMEMICPHCGKTIELQVDTIETKVDVEKLNNEYENISHKIMYIRKQVEDIEYSIGKKLAELSKDKKNKELQNILQELEYKREKLMINLEELYEKANNIAT